MGVFYGIVDDSFWEFYCNFVRVVADLIFVEGSGVLFKVILALLSHHKDALLECDGFEQIMDYLKITVPEIDKNILDFVIKQVNLYSFVFRGYLVVMMKLQFSLFFNRSVRRMYRNIS